MKRSSLWLFALFSAAVVAGLIYWLSSAANHGSSPSTDSEGALKAESQAVVLANDLNHPDSPSANGASNGPSRLAMPEAAAQDRINPFEKFGLAINQQQALEAIRIMERENPASALDAKAGMSACRIIGRAPNYFASFPNSWHKAELIKFCQGYSEPLEADLHAQARKDGAKAKITRELQALEQAQGVDAMLEKAEALLKTENDPFVVQALFEHLFSDVTRSGKVDEVLFNKLLYDFPLTAGLPRGPGGVNQAYGTLPIMAHLGYCELAGGCGPFHILTLDVCNAFGECPPGASLRDYYNLTTSPILMQAVDIVLARWRAAPMRAVSLRILSFSLCGLGGELLARSSGLAMKQ